MMMMKLPFSLPHQKTKLCKSCKTLLDFLKVSLFAYFLLKYS